MPFDAEAQQTTHDLTADGCDVNVFKIDAESSQSDCKDIWTLRAYACFVVDMLTGRMKAPSKSLTTVAGVCKANMSAFVPTASMTPFLISNASARGAYIHPACFLS